MVARRSRNVSSSDARCSSSGRCAAKCGGSPGHLAHDAELDELGEAVVDVHPQAAERRHQRLDVEGLLRSRAQETQQSRAQRRLNEVAKARIHVRRSCPDEPERPCAGGEPGSNRPREEPQVGVFTLSASCARALAGRQSDAKLRRAHSRSGRRKDVSTVPYRAPGSPGKNRHLSGKPIRYYRPRGSADIRTLIDEGFQAFNAARLGEACRIFTDKMLLPGARHDHRA